MIKHWHPRSLTAQILLVALTGLVLAQILSIQVYRTERNDALGQVNSRFALLRIISAVRLLSDTPAELHREILRASRSENLMLRLQTRPLQPKERNHGYEERIRRELNYPDDLAILVSVEQAEGKAPPPELRMHQKSMQGRRLPPRDIRLYGTIQLPNAQWLNFSSMSDPELPGWSPRSIVTLLALGALIALIVTWLLRRATRPLQQLANQAEVFGRGHDIPPLVESGPKEVSDTLAAFNRMQTRLNRFVQDRTQMLAAISHDLRTPLTSLRLRSEFLPESEDKLRMQQTLTQMEEMLKATLRFVRDDHRSDPSREVDLTSLLESLCDDYQDSGRAVEFKAHEKLIYACRPTQIRRAVQNLIDNALTYAGHAQVECVLERQQIVLRVLDSGPGIPEELLEQVFQPFVRLDEARNTESASVGLGLAIARTLVHQHGGAIILENRASGGLCASIVLPR